MQLFSVSLVLLGVSLGLASPEVSEVKLVRGGCPLFWFSFNGRCYKYVATHLTWADAEINCLSQNAHLVSIHNLEEHNFVKMLIKNCDVKQGVTWIGLSDIHKEGVWMWSDGSPRDFNPWNTGEPNNYRGNEHCGSTSNGRQKNWNDAPCSGSFASVCATRKPGC